MANAAHTESLSELERRAESTRAELAQTVDALHNRVSPSALKADMKKVGDVMLKEWLEKAGPEGKQLVDAFLK